MFSITFGGVAHFDKKPVIPYLSSFTKCIFIEEPSKHRFAEDNAAVMLSRNSPLRETAREQQGSEGKETPKNNKARIMLDGRGKDRGWKCREKGVSAGEDKEKAVV